MPPKARSPTPPLLPAILLALTTSAWIALELYSIQGFGHGIASYDWQIESLSDLGVDYRQVHPLKHYAIESFLSWYQNVNFIQAGICFGLAQLLLLFTTPHTLRTFRVLLAALYATGMILFGMVHGGPREKVWEVIGWHWTGFALAAVAGNLSLILAAIGSSIHERSPIYRLFSLALGLVGLYSFYQFQSLGPWNFQTKIGLWQRGAIYPVLAWNIITAVAIVSWRNVASSRKAKKA